MLKIIKKYLENIPKNNLYEENPEVRHIGVFNNGERITSKSRQEFNHQISNILSENNEIKIKSYEEIHIIHQSDDQNFHLTFVINKTKRRIYYVIEIIEEEIEAITEVLIN